MLAKTVLKSLQLPSGISSAQLFFHQIIKKSGLVSAEDCVLVRYFPHRHLHEVDHKELEVTLPTSLSYSYLMLQIILVLLILSLRRRTVFREVIHFRFYNLLG